MPRLTWLLCSFLTVTLCQDCQMIFGSLQKGTATKAFQAMPDLSERTIRKEAPFVRVEQRNYQPFLMCDLPQQENLPFVIADGEDFLSFAYYSDYVQKKVNPNTAFPLFYYLADTMAAVEFTGTDSFEHELLILRQTGLLPGHNGIVVEPASFLKEHKRFWVTSSNPVTSWIPRYLISRGVRLTLVSDDGKQKIYLAEVPTTI